MAAVIPVLATGLVTMAAPASAAATDHFEISDANIVDSALSPLVPDWGGVFGRANPLDLASPIVVTNPFDLQTPSFVEDPLKSDALPTPTCSPGKTGDLTVFASTSDKNGDDINTWTFSSGSVPPNKDDLTNVYAAAGKDGDDTIFYFALERADTNGSGHVDFEFLHSAVGLVPTGTDPSGCPSGLFSGSRTVGDVLLSLNFENGGTVGVEDIRLWDGDSYEVPPGDLSDVVKLFQNPAAIACGDWRCRDSSGSLIPTIPANGFVEGFINATALDVSGCFSNFNAKSRSSHEYNSELKDFAIGEFNTCDARISITPDGVNEVGDAHTFTADVDVSPEDVFVPAPDGTLVAFEILSGPGSFVAGIDSCLTTGGLGQCSVQVVSDEAGTTVVAASTTVGVGPLEITRSTDGDAGPGGSGNAVKEWVDGYVKVTPDGVNEIGDPHDFTVEFGVLPGGADTVSTPEITASVTGPPAELDDSDCATPTEVDTNVWQCTVTINSPVTGTFVATAIGSATVSKTGVPGEVTIVRTTSEGLEGPGGNTGATKRYVTATIDITPDGVNEVGDPHTFDIIVTAAPSQTEVEFGPIVTSIVPVPDEILADTCDSPTIDGNTATCSITIVSHTAGVFVANATAQVTLGGVVVDLATDGTGGSGPATKTYVDATLAITPDGVNAVGDPHVITGLVLADHGLGPVPAPDGTVISFTIEEGPGTLSAPSCATAAGTGTCTVTLVSGVAGVTVVSATTTVDVEGLVLERATSGEGGSSGTLTKRWVDAAVTIGPPDAQNEVGDAHVFDVTVTAIPSGAGPIAFDSITTTVAPTPDVVATTCTTPVVTGNVATCTVTINSAAIGVFLANVTARVTIGGATVVRSTDATVAPAGPGGSGPARKEYVDTAVFGVTIEPPPPVRVLARTGWELRGYVDLGTTLVGAGAALVLLSRQRRRVSRAV